MLNFISRTRTAIMSSKSWLSIPASSHFSLANIPFGIISTASDKTPRPAIAIGDHCLDLKAFAADGGFKSVQVDTSVFSSPTLNAFAALGRPVHRSVRGYLQDVFSEDTKHAQVLKDNTSLQESALLKRDQVKMHLPMQIGDYTDFYAGKNHAFNLGCILRDPKNALQPNYTHLPVGYHGRASSVVVSGTPITRPNGQILENPAADPKIPTFSPCRRLDIELEIGVFIGKDNDMGSPVPISKAADSIFGYVLMNDWSARDIQAWEYVPLGPFNAKNFGTTISPWVVLTDALEPFKAKGIQNDSQLLPYLQEKEEKNVFDIKLGVDLARKSLPPFFDKANRPQPKENSQRGSSIPMGRTSSSRSHKCWLITPLEAARCVLVTYSGPAQSVVRSKAPREH